MIIFYIIKLKGRDKMKFFRMLAISLFSIVLSGCLNNASVYDNELKKYANLFNDYHYVTAMSTGGYNVKAEAKDNKLIVTTWENEELLYNVTDNILEGTVSYVNSNLSQYLVDCIAQSQGGVEDEFYNAIPTFPDDENNLTLEENGIEIVMNTTASDSEEWTYTIKADLSKKIKFSN